MKVRSSVFASFILIFEVIGVALFLRGFFPVPVKSSVSSKSKLSDLPPEPVTGGCLSAWPPSLSVCVCQLQYLLPGLMVSFLLHRSFPQLHTCAPSPVWKSGHNAGGRPERRLCLWTQRPPVHALHQTCGGKKLLTQFCGQSQTPDCHHAQDQGERMTLRCGCVEVWGTADKN